MNKKLAVQIMGLVCSVTIGVAGLVIQYKKRIELTDADREYIVKRVSSEIKNDDKQS